MGKSRAFTPEEVELCKVFAAQVAVTIENAQLKRRLRELDDASLCIRPLKAERKSWAMWQAFSSCARTWGRPLAKDDDDVEILERFANNAALAWESSRLTGQAAQKVARIAILQRITDYIQVEPVLDKVDIVKSCVSGTGAKMPRGLVAAALIMSGTVLTPSSVAVPIGENMRFSCDSIPNPLHIL